MMSPSCYFLKSVLNHLITGGKFSTWALSSVTMMANKLQGKNHLNNTSLSI